MTAPGNAKTRLRAVTAEYTYPPALHPDNTELCDIFFAPLFKFLTKLDRMPATDERNLIAAFANETIETGSVIVGCDGLWRLPSGWFEISLHGISGRGPRNIDAIHNWICMACTIRNWKCLAEVAA